MGVCALNCANCVGPVRQRAAGREQLASPRCGPSEVAAGRPHRTTETKPCKLNASESHTHEMRAAGGAVAVGSVLYGLVRIALTDSAPLALVVGRQQLRFFGL